MLIVALSICVCSVPALAVTLRDAVERAISTHPSVMMSRSQSLAAKEGIREAKGAYYPSVDLATAYGNEWTSSPFTRDLAGDESNTLWRREFSVSMTQNIYAGGAIFEEVNRNVALFKAQNYKTWSVINDLALEVADAYVEVLLRDRLVEIAEINFAEHQRLVNLIRQRGEAGVARFAELDQGESRLALADSNLINARGNSLEAKIRYRKLVGDWPEDLVAPLIPKNDNFPQEPEVAIREGLNNHPTVRSANEDIKQAVSQRKVMKAAFYPRVDAVVTISRNQNLDGVPGHNDENVSLLRMNYNLFKGGTDFGRFRKAAFQVQEAFETRDRSMIDLREKIQLDYNAWNASRKRAVVLYDYIVSIEKTRKSYFEQFQIGQRTFLDLLNSQNEVYRSKNDYLQASKDEISARYRILNSTGRLLDFFAKQREGHRYGSEIFIVPSVRESLEETFEIKDKPTEQAELDSEMVYPSGETKLPDIKVDLEDDLADKFISSDIESNYTSVIPVIGDLALESKKAKEISRPGMKTQDYLVELSGFKNIQLANRTIRVLQRKGYKAEVTVDTSTDLNMIHVQVGPYKDENDAKEVLDYINSRLHLYGVVRPVNTEDPLSKTGT